MNQNSISFTSTRARKARLSLTLGKSWLRGVFSAGFILGVLLGTLLIASGQHLLGALLMGVGVYFLLPVLWYNGELKNLAVTAPVGTGQIDQILDQKLLARLQKNASPQAIASAAMKTDGGVFFANRYGIIPDFLGNMVSGEPEAAEAVWNKARDLALLGGGKSISSADVMAALLFSIPSHDYFFAQLQLDEDDIRSGLKWYNHIQDVFRQVAVKQGTGGLGRDLSFGWAPLLNRVGLNLSESVRGGMLHREIEGHDEALQQVMHLLSQPGRRNATLVGEVGVGKTTLVYALAQKLMSQPKLAGEALRYRQIIALDAASLLSKAKGRGELEELLIRLFNEAIHAKNIIIFLDEAQLFLKEGTGSVDLSSILMPVLEGGGLQVILAVSDQEWLRISQTNPGLAQLMNRVVVSPLNEEDTMRVVEDQVILMESRSPVVYTYQSLKEAYSLANRFIREQAFPGKAIKLLEAASGFVEQKYFITAKSVQQAVEKSFDVKVQTANTTEERDTLLNLEGKIHERMVNQTHAVKVVSDALRRARAGVRNQNKPIGTFLFLGPTGVGKTELSKALAAVYFGGEDRLVRVDLNEYSQASDVSRLLEIGAENSHSLTAQIAKQPFSVVLLDEIEKAHPNVLNVLLQMLDEGMLRDSQNKPVSFRDAIIIATSNAGADKIRAHIEAGETLEQFEDQFIDELINSNIFRPEFINRFDETVLFRPLNKEELTQVVDLIVAGINKTLVPQKVSITLTQPAKTLLAEAGYDPRLGARPLRRTAQRSIENILAQKLLSGGATPGSVIELDAPEIRAALEQRAS